MEMVVFVTTFFIFYNLSSAKSKMYFVCLKSYAVDLLSLRLELLLSKLMPKSLMIIGRKPKAWAVILCKD